MTTAEIFRVCPVLLTSVVTVCACSGSAGSAIASSAAKAARTATVRNAPLGAGLVGAQATPARLATERYHLSKHAPQILMLLGAYARSEISVNLTRVVERHQGAVPDTR